jgi:hypothetical protein
MGGKGLNPEVSPGESYNWTLMATLGKEDVATDVLIEVLGYGESPQGGVQPLLPEGDKSQYSARTFIQPGKTTLHVEPGETNRANVTVTIPADVGSDGRYATLRFSTLPVAGAGGVGVVSAIVLPMKFTIKNSQLIHTGVVQDVTIGKTESGIPIDIFTIFRNTGNHHFNIKDQTEILDVTGKLLDTIFTNASSPIPEGTKSIKTTFIPKSDLREGTYSVKSTLTLEDGTFLDEATGVFEVGKPYVPPLPPASVTLNPANAAKLETKNGEISISFPKEAVLAPVEVSLRSYPLEQLPSPPTGYALTTNCFRVDGLTGLLANEATVTVKYTQADLEKAKSDASTLKLARWDEVRSQWLVLDTKLDKSSMTLTTTTNQFSIWAVLVAPPTNINLWLIGGATIGIVILASLFIIFRIRRNRS